LAEHTNPEGIFEALVNVREYNLTVLVALDSRDDSGAGVLGDSLGSGRQVGFELTKRHAGLGTLCCQQLKRKTDGVSESRLAEGRSDA